jgi:hypothetical protein
MVTHTTLWLPQDKRSFNSEFFLNLKNDILRAFPGSEIYQSGRSDRPETLKIAVENSDLKFLVTIADSSMRMLQLDIAEGDQYILHKFFEDLKFELVSLVAGRIYMRLEEGLATLLFYSNIDVVANEPGDFTLNTLAVIQRPNMVARSHFAEYRAVDRNGVLTFVTKDTTIDFELAGNKFLRTMFEKWGSRQQLADWIKRLRSVGPVLHRSDFERVTRIANEYLR